MKIHKFSSQWGAAVLIGALGSFLAGCGSGTADVREQMAKDRLEAARTAYAEAKGSTIVESYGMKQLLVAEQTLKDAEQAMKKAYAPNPANPAQGYSQNEKDAMFDDVSRLSYMAGRNSQGAISYAEGVVAGNEKLQLGKELAEVQLLKSNIEKDRLEKDISAKTNALERARQELNAATSEAERARILADINAKEALLAKAQAEAKAREAEQARAEMEQLVRELSDLQGKMTDRGIVLTIGDVLFATGKSNLNSSAQRSMEKIAEFMLKKMDRNLLVEGHTDSVGGDEYNQGLSEQRAASVKSAIVDLGVASERIVTIGYGKRYPLASNDTAAGRQQNRRVEVVILNPGVKPESQFRK